MNPKERAQKVFASMTIGQFERTSADVKAAGPIVDRIEQAIIEAVRARDEEWLTAIEGRTWHLFANNVVDPSACVAALRRDFALKEREERGRCAGICEGAGHPELAALIRRGP